MQCLSVCVKPMYQSSNHSWLLLPIWPRINQRRGGKKTRDNDTTGRDCQVFSVFSHTNTTLQCERLTRTPNSDPNTSYFLSDCSPQVNFYSEVLIFTWWEGRGWHKSKRAIDSYVFQSVFCLLVELKFSDRQYHTSSPWSAKVSPMEFGS